MTQKVWEEVADNRKLQKLLNRKEQEWILLSLDGYCCHCTSVRTLELFRNAKILVFQERSQNSDILQVLDVNVYIIRFCIWIFVMKQVR